MWITVVFASLTVAGVLVVVVFGIRAAQLDVADAERVESAVDGVLAVHRAVLALEEERGLAELWLNDPAPEVGSAYASARSGTDAALNSLRVGWRSRQEVFDESGPPTLTDFEDGMATLTALRVAALRARENSTVEAYTAVSDVLIAKVRRMEGMTLNSDLSPQVRSLVRILEAGEALAGQRDIVLGIITGGDPVREDELVRLLLQRQQARANLSGIEGLRPMDAEEQIDELLVSMATDEAHDILQNLEFGGPATTAADWYRAASTRLETLAMVGAAVRSELAIVSDELREAAERTAALRTVGLTGLLVISVVAGAAAVGTARERARALDEHGDLAAGLLEWFQPDRLQDIEALDVAGRYDAASEYTRAGGDWYDVYRIEDGRVAITIGDVAGHGAYATAQMAQARNLLRGVTLAANETSPAGHLRALDTALQGSGTMVSVFHALLDQDGGRLVYVRAGHVPGVVRHGGAVEMLDGGLGPPAGAGSGLGYTDASVQLSSPWLLVLLTDGLVEDRTIDLEASLAALVDKVEVASDDIDRLADELIASRPEQSDDAALLVISSDPVRAADMSAAATRPAMRNDP